jgi:flagellar motility protein MotE (MotC chaperone)
MMKQRKYVRHILAAFMAAFALVGLSSSHASDEAAHGGLAADASESEIQKFCSNVVDPAREQRYLSQKQELEQLQADVNQRLTELETRKTEYQDWIKRRDDFMAKAEDSIVGMYKNMKPDAAAPLLAELDSEISAAILLKLAPKQSGLILANMDAVKAAELTRILSQSADPNTSKGRS